MKEKEPQKKILTEFLCRGKWDTSTAWAETKEEAEEYCKFNGIKLIKFGLRTTEVEE